MKNKFKQLKPIFKKMEDMGWDLDREFGETYQIHKDFIDNIVEEEREGDREEDELVWCCQFIGDFLYCLEEYMEEKENKK